jgi:hypothetical protein
VLWDDRGRWEEKEGEERRICSVLRAARRLDAWFNEVDVMRKQTSLSFTTKKEGAWKAETRDLGERQV